MISYAQNREDVLLDRVFPRGVDGFYVDVGANLPVEGSITKHFYDLGWRGVNIEPSSTFEELAAARERDVNLNVGVSDQAGTLPFFEFSPPLSTASTFSAEAAALHGEAGLPFVERSVPVRTLADICEEYVEGTIDFLSVDVEGHELEVLRGADWARWRPRVVLVEATRPRTTTDSSGATPLTHEVWEPVLLEADYLFATFDGLNRYYVRSEDERLVPSLQVPVNVTDDYVPHELAAQIEHWRWAFESAQRQLAAARAVNVALSEERAAFAPELSVLRAEYERLERALTSTRAQYETTRQVLLEARLQYEQLLPEIERVRERTEASHAMFEVVGPDGLGIARRVTALSARHPRAGTSVKKGLRAALGVKRRLGRRAPEASTAGASGGLEDAD